MHELPIPSGYAPYGESAARIKANSKLLVVLFEAYFCCQHVLLCVYDLEALKTGTCSADKLLLHTMRVPYPVHVVSVDVTHIVYGRHVAMSCNKLYSKLSVYDLKCLKETETVPSHLLLTSFDLDWIVKKVAMNETRIVCLDDNKM